MTKPPDKPLDKALDKPLAKPPAQAHHPEPALVPAKPSAPEPALVPELLVTDLDRSLDFWCGACGFTVSYSRPEEGFAYITRGTAHLMLEMMGGGRHWVTGPLQPPFGRGINFQISVPDAASLASSLSSAGIELYLPLETTWYRIGVEEAGVAQFLVTDPDGYLLRFQSSLGRRSAPTGH